MELHYYTRVHIKLVSAEIKVMKEHKQKLLRRRRRAEAALSKEPPLEPQELRADISAQRDMILKDIVDLQNKGINDMSRQARAVNLAMAFLRGRPYAKVETLAKSADKARSRPLPNFALVANVIRGSTAEFIDERVIMQRFSAWVDEALAHIKTHRAALGLEMPKPKKRRVPGLLQAISEAMQQGGGGVATSLGDGVVLIGRPPTMH